MPDTSRARRVIILLERQFLAAGAVTAIATASE